MSDNTLEAPVVEGSFAQKWEEFIEGNDISPEVAEKLQFIYYAGAHAVFEELSEVSPAANNPVGIQHAVMAFGALQGEVFGFFEEREEEEDISVLTIREEVGDGLNGEGLEKELHG